MRTLGIFSLTMVLYFCVPAYVQAITVTGDFDGDGQTDVAVYEDATGNWFIKQSTAGFRIVGHFGGPGFVPVPGDYDGDGKTDIAVYQAATGNWFVVGSAFDFFTPALNFGGPGFIPMPGDFDGDGVTDPAVYQERTGNWFALRSSTGFTAPALNFGGLNFIPASLPSLAGLPDVRGLYAGSSSFLQAACANLLNAGSFIGTGSANISAQTGSSFSGTATLTSGSDADTITFSGTVTTGGQVSGTFTFNLFVSGMFAGSGSGTFTGQLTDNQLLANFAGQFTVAEICMVKGSILVSR
jgi:FG-GAP-like repeat